MARSKVDHIFDLVSVLQILKSPMILMGIVGMVVVFGMPKLMNNRKLLHPLLRGRFPPPLFCFCFQARI